MCMYSLDVQGRSALTIGLIHWTDSACTVTMEATLYAMPRSCIPELITSQTMAQSGVVCAEIASQEANE
ncbi:hypothetical protein KIL84_000728 [Mauremys mutica]|uniref:Uncharacterized protein n=1 Tax=Mauremys mutica TaxID=74926 RepID=A0A9D3WZJ5_9SAUR|nr:hypothetical protein KIL84_000728 [Mauremys mutica]